ncbi:recombinase family protein [Halococcus sp. AFM35]|uniref:recombinase family protein n=1 Tax=Halococcus sp. AFM35 TaxID=3421653 RepID=UPI003EB8D615
MTPKTAIYIRVAPGTESTREQREAALEYAADVLGIDPADGLVLTDSGTYTRTDDSSGHQRLFDLAADGAIERVIMCDAARIATNMRDLNDRVTQLVESGVAVHIIEPGIRIGEPGEDAGPDDRTLLRVLGIAAELETAVNSERTREGIAAAKAEGKHVGRPPFGFDADGEGGLIPNEDFETALAVIEEIEAGESKRSTARRAGVTRSTVGNIIDQKEQYLDYAAGEE